jgi:hypothetical protein
MCPSVIAPCATSPGEVVTNGLLQKRSGNGKFWYCSRIKARDFKPLLNLVLSPEWNSKVSNKKHGIWKLKSTSTKMIDFTQSKVSSDIPKTSYVPGTTSVEMGQVFLVLTQILREGFLNLGNPCVGI